MYKVRTSMKSLLAITKDDNSRETINCEIVNFVIRLHLVTNFIFYVVVYNLQAR